MANGYGLYTPDPTVGTKSFSQGIRTVGQLAGLQQRQQAIDIQQQKLAHTQALQDEETAYGTALSDHVEKGLPPIDLIQQFPKKQTELLELNQAQQDLKDTDAVRLTGSLINALDRDDMGAANRWLSEGSDIINNIGPAGFTVEQARQMLTENKDGLRQLALGTYKLAGGKVDDLVDPESFSNIYYDDQGNPLGLSSESGTFERIQAEAPRAKPTPKTVVNLGEKGRTEEQKALAKSRVGKYERIGEKADTAFNQLESINQLRTIDLETGFGTELKTTGARIINALGGDGEQLLGVDISDVEKFNSVAEKQVLDVMASQSGPQTDQDAARIKRTVAATENTKEANDYILNSMEALANRRIEQSNFWTDYLESNDGSLKGVDKDWNEYKRMTPMVSDVVKNPTTGKPMFFYQFRQLGKAKNYSESDIIDAWREITGGK